MAEFDAPQSRNEAILQNILGADNVLLPPQSRNEAILQNILGADNVLLPPQSRIEELLMQLLEEWPVGPQGVPENDVNFYDYDGAIVASYTAEQFGELEEIPENPDHTDEGLTSQGWNWSLANAKAYVAKYGKLNVGQMYVPTDGKTHVFINIPADDPSYETTLYFGHTTASGQTVIDWGDGSPTETVSGESAAEHSHTYANPGKYEITLDTISGIMDIHSSGSGRAIAHFSGRGNIARHVTSIEKIHLSNKVTIGAYAFNYCMSLKSITIPNNITSIGEYAFYYCVLLQTITIPSNVATIQSGVFQYCESLKSVSIPNGVTNIGSYAFQYCYQLKAVTIPHGVVSLDTSAFYQTFSLQSLVIADSVTSIGTTTFSACQCLRTVIIPNNVTDIGTFAFNGCYSTVCFHFKPETPPTLSASNAFSGIPADTVFYVPASSLEAYKTANNWSSYADRMVGE